MPAKPWFRLYHDLLDDPKVQRLPPDLFRAWINVLCLACRHDGILPDVPDLAFGLRCSEDEVRRLLARLLEAALLDQTPAGLAPHNWQGRQFASDTSTGRVQEHRRRRRQPTPPDDNGTRTVPRPVPRNVSRNVSATLHETHQSRADTEQRLTGNPRTRAHPRAGDASCVNYEATHFARMRARLDARAAAMSD